MTNRTMTQFHEGQEVEVREVGTAWIIGPEWTTKAKIARLLSASTATFESPFKWQVQLLDGSLAVFDADRIRAIEKSIAPSTKALDDAIAKREKAFAALEAAEEELEVAREAFFGTKRQLEGEK